MVMSLWPRFLVHPVGLQANYGPVSVISPKCAETTNRARIWHGGFLPPILHDVQYVISE